MPEMVRTTEVFMRFRIRAVIAVLTDFRVLSNCLERQYRVGRWFYIVISGPGQMLHRCEAAATRPTLFRARAAAIVVLARKSLTTAFFRECRNREAGNRKQIGSQHQADAKASPIDLPELFPGPPHSFS